MAFVTTESFEDDKNRHILTHWHERIEVIRVVEGSMTCIINGTPNELKKNDICIINCKQTHRLCYIEGAACVFQRFMVDLALLREDRGVYQKYILPLLSDDSFAHVHSRNGYSCTSTLLNLIDEIADLERIKPVAYELGIIALIYTFFRQLYQFYALQKQSANVEHSADILLYRQMAAFIYQNYSEKLTLDMIANSGNVSKSKCCQVFKEYADHSPIEFLNLYRLERSTNILLNTSNSIASISSSCGFGQQSYYNRLFLKEYGVTPKEYRRLSAEKTKL